MRAQVCPGDLTRDEGCRQLLARRGYGLAGLVPTLDGVGSPQAYDVVCQRDARDLSTVRGDCHEGGCLGVIGHRPAERPAVGHRGQGGEVGGHGLRDTTVQEIEATVHVSPGNVAVVLGRDVSVDHGDVHGDARLLGVEVTDFGGVSPCLGAVLVVPQAHVIVILEHSGPVAQVAHDGHRPLHRHETHLLACVQGLAHVEEELPFVGDAGDNGVRDRGFPRGRDLAVRDSDRLPVDDDRVVPG